MAVTSSPALQAEKSTVFVPLVVGDQVRGLINLLDMEREHAFSEADVRLLQTLANSMSVALENARLFDETQRLLKETDQRAAELAIINSVQEGLASKLDMQAIYDLVGDRICEILDAQGVTIMEFDHARKTTSYAYVMEKGHRFHPEPRPFTRYVKNLIKTHEPVLMNDNVQQRFKELGVTTLPGTEPSKSYLGMPLSMGGEVKWAIGVYNTDRENAFSDSDLRLLTTLANSMGVSLENARLFNETQRLLKETDQRAAELAIINSVQAALAAELNIQGIYDTVGDKIRKIFHNADTGIRIYDPKTRLESFPYAYENGQRFTLEPRQLGEGGFSAHVYRTREILVINENMAEAIKKYGSHTLPGSKMEKSSIFVPLVVGDQARGLINLVDMEREQAFSEADVRLLQTLANSMSVALENARLFNETQRLLKETEQRAAELAVINSIQQGLAAELDFQAIVDLVGDKLRQVLNTGDIGIRWHDPNMGLVRSLYEFEHGKRINIPDVRATAKHIVQLQRTRKPIIFNTFGEARKLGLSAVPGTDQSKSGVIVPILGSDRVLGHITTENYERENAYTEADIRLLTTVASSMGVALENARLFAETQRLLKETEQRAAELAIINSVQEALASKLDMQAIYDLVGDKIQSMFNAQSVIIGSFDHEKQLSHANFAYENGQHYC